MGGDIILEFVDICKEYPGVQALNNVSFTLRSGEVHALVGENGAGKSTLIKTCSGAVRPASGKIIVRGKPYDHLTPITSMENGIAVIYQETSLVKEISVWENIFLGEFMRSGLLINKRGMIERANALFAQLGMSIDPEALVKDLTIGYQQMVEIAKALSRDAQILVMDEPSAALTNAEVDTMMALVRKLRASGVGIIYISHRLDEVFEISDRTTVLRDGCLVVTEETKNLTRDSLIRLMVNRDMSETYPERPPCADTEVLLEVRNISGNGLSDVSLHVRRGEILGLGGLVGAGRTELAEILFGKARPRSGEILYKGKPVRFRIEGDAIRQGIALVPEDRKRQGVLLHMSAQDNITLPVLKGISRVLVINARSAKGVVRKYWDALRIKMPNPRMPAANLSGGNQQKIVLAKWLATDSELIIFDEPTRGIDVGAKREIYMIMNELIASGKTIIMISSDMEELMGVSDRIVVLAEGRVAGELARDSFNQETILEYASSAS
ncbi:MAG: sugar ABC transporter ATP-binding protein [Clostridiales Family XIII bacterium]|jgi:ribose transport system ATP-binding protein|nr:sugar ABC transporter ATP-binding protein [Clostridiales Family XIII bacterium]